MPSLSIHPLSILFCWPPDHPELAYSPIITRATSVYARKWGAIRVWSLSDRIASRCYWSRSHDRAPVSPTHISLLCAPDGVNTDLKYLRRRTNSKSGVLFPTLLLQVRLDWSSKPRSSAGSCNSDWKLLQLPPLSSSLHPQWCESIAEGCKLNN